MLNFKDFLVAFFSLFDVISGAVLALSYGFYMFPSAIGYATGAIGGLLTKSATPVSFMYESMVLSWSQSKSLRDRISMILLAAFLTGALGLFGLPEIIVHSIGIEVFLGMLAGVGLYLAKVGFEIARLDFKIGLPCMIVAIITQLFFNDLVTTVSISISLGILLNFIYEKNISKKGAKEYKIPKYKSWKEMVKKELKIIPWVLNKKVLIGALALSTLTIGGNIAYIAANSEISHTTPTYNSSTVISGVTDFASSLFGGANMELIVSPTAAAPHAAASAVIFMVLATLLLATGFIHKIAHRIPLSAMGGYLFVIGAIIILPYNAVDALQKGSPSVVALTITFTFLTNPFYGIIAGTIAKLLI